MKSQQDIINSLPVHLRPFISKQNYDDYTPQDQAVWRFLMYQLTTNLKASAHPLYFDGLKGTGIDVESIPKIEVMNQQLSKIGWRAAVVDGFIPPAIFIEFLAHRVLVVAVNIRSIDHMLYTPAPDIIHESAGHAPFIIDIDYAEYLENVGKVGRRVISSKGDIDFYEAIRALSIIKESPDSSAQEIADAEQHLTNTIDKYKDDKPSEATLLSRLQWWTTEYGLVGTVDDYRIYGAGLLSSLGESTNCLDDDKVKKIPLTINAIATTYDITNEQPNLFVAKNCRHLSQIAEEFERSLCYYKGGSESLCAAVEAETVNTAVYCSGLEVSGVISNVVRDATGNVIYFNTTGPTQLAYREKEIEGHGTDYHAPGFGSPVGKLQAQNRCLSTYSIDNLKLYGIEIGKRVQLEFLSGITVDGVLISIYRRDGKNLLLSFEDCTVTDLENNMLFAPDWGTYDMAVGQDITSVYGGSADQSTYPLYKQPSDSVTLKTDFDQEKLALFDFYRQIRALRESGEQDAARLSQLTQDYVASVHEEWLVYFELLELNVNYDSDQNTITSLRVKLVALRAEANEETQTLINYGLNRFSITE
ncbi:MAG: aromatic amino acid hydroxylase [Alteromonadaceae bacterium]|nr:aromatic amino acid hydroxylase [Alteromonadaceae bacterium]